MSWRVAFVLGAAVALALAGCSRAARVVVAPETAPIVIAPAPEPKAPPPEEPAPAAAEPATPSEGESTEVKIELPLRLGTSCTLVFRAGTHDKRPDNWIVTSIDRIRTEESPGCGAAVLFDLAAERAADPEEKTFHEALAGGLLAKNGAAGDPGDPVGIAFVDMNFDGYLDFNVHVLMGAYNESRSYWIYDPKTRSFALSDRLGGLLWPTFDAATKVVKAGGRMGGPMYGDGVYGWIGGKLETLESTTSTLGEKPNGDPLPAGFARWETRYRRKKDALVKVFDGPVKD